MNRPTLSECIEIAQERIQDAQYRLNKAEAPFEKRNHQKSINFWGAIIDNLIELKSLKSSNS